MKKALLGVIAGGVLALGIFFAQSDVSTEAMELEPPILPVLGDDADDM